MKKRRKKKKFPRLKRSARRKLWARKTENRKFMLEYLLKHPCVDCGEKDILVLEFHHLDRSKKRGTVGSLLQLSLDTVKKEIDKCCALCANCHRRRTAVQLGWRRRIALSERQKEGLC